MGGVDPAGLGERAEDVPLNVNLPLFEPTYTVSQLCGEVKSFLNEAFGSVWVAGEAQRVRPSQRGHLYFELVEKGEADEIVGKVEAVIWKNDLARVKRLLAGSDQQIADGMQVRCRGGLDFYGPTGRAQLCVREVDPVFTLGLLERRRRETLAALAASGLLERNRALTLPDLPLRLALITSSGSAAYHDFLSSLRESGYGFQVVLLHASVQGRDAEREVVSALAALAGLPVDCAVLIRGGGSRSDLAVFDSRRIAEAIAASPLPILTGLGHEIDQAIADLVAHTALKTPTKTAEFLIEAVRKREERLVELRRAILREAMEPLRNAHEALGRAERGIDLARMRLTAAGSQLNELSRAFVRMGRNVLRAAIRREAEISGRFTGAARRRVAAGERGRLALGERLAAAARGRLREMDVRLDGLSRLCSQLAPERTLERGFTLTRDDQGRVLRRPDQVAAGDRITTRFASGELLSRVEEG
jgi:exodeoxyribonuclease VII large subunit